MRRVLLLVEALQLLLIFVGPVAYLTEAFPADFTETTEFYKNETAPDEKPEGLTEYPVFSEPKETNLESNDSPTEGYAFIEEQEEDDDEGSGYTTSPIVRTTEAMRSPKSSREQEEVLRELKKLWDLKEGLDNEEGSELKTSLSSIVHLAYARVYTESDDVLQKLKYLLQKLQARLLGKDETTSLSSQSENDERNYPPTTPSPTNLMGGNDPVRSRQRRSYYEPYQDIESIFFANSEENSVIPDERNYYLNETNNEGEKKKYVESTAKNNLTDDGRAIDPGTVVISKSSSTTIMALTDGMVMTTPSSLAQKVVHINDRQKPMPTFFLTPERMQQLKNQMKTTAPTLSTLSPISIAIQDELENEVNSLQQQQVDSYDVHISENFKGKPLKPMSPSTSTEMPYSAEEIALALFQLLRPEPNEIERVTMPSKPKPSVLYQVGALNSVLNFTISPKPTTEKLNEEKPSTTSTTTTTTPPTLPPSMVSLMKLQTMFKRNSTLLGVPSELSNLGQPPPQTTTRRTTTSNWNVYQNDAGDYDDVLDQKPPSSGSLLDGTREFLEQLLLAITKLSIGAKIVLLFSVSISILSIGFGLYALGPPLLIVGILGVIIPLALLLLLESTPASGKQDKSKELLRKVESEEFSRILDLIMDAVSKYGG